MTIFCHKDKKQNLNFANLQKSPIMNRDGCIITYPVEGYEEHTVKCAIRLGVNKVILMDENESYIDLFNRFEF